MKPKTLEEILANTERKESGCWEWRGYKSQLGYGRLQVNRKPWKVHRLVMFLLGHTLTPKIFVCHKCDNPPCVNPDHLFLGDNKTNSADKVAKGRQLKGEKTWNAKLTESQVQEIRKRYYREKVSQSALAKEFGVRQSVIGGIVRNQDWKDENAPELDFSRRARKLDETTVNEIREIYSKGIVTQRELAYKYGVSFQHINNIVLNKRRKPNDNSEHCVLSKASGAKESM